MTRRTDELTEAAALAHGVLMSYADRGLFRGFGWRPTRSGAEFRFQWHAPEPTTLLLKVPPTRAAGSKGKRYRGTVIALPALLPEVPYKSSMDREFRNFLVGRQNPDLPEHRRVDPKRVTVLARNRNGNLGLELISLEGDLTYLTRKTIALVNEVFHSFLSGPYEAYMVTVFGAPEE